MIATTRTQLRISSVRPIRLPKSRMPTHRAKVPTPIRYTSSPCSGPAKSRKMRKKIAPAAAPAQPGQPTCRKYRAA